MKRNSICLLVILITVIFISCTGKQGATGPAGPQKAGVYYEGYFQQGVYPASNTVQVEAELYGGYTGVTYTTNIYPLGVGTSSLLIPFRSIIKFDISSLPKSNIMIDKAQVIINTDGNSAARWCKKCVNL